MSKKIFISLWLILSLVSSALHASESLYEEELPVVWSSIMIIDGGVSWATPGQNQYLYPQPLPNYQYYQKSSKQSTLGAGGVFFGLQRYIYPYIIGQLGIGAAGVSDALVTGNVNNSGVPNIFSYSYKVNSARLELKGKVISTAYRGFQPFFSGSIGPAFNQSHAYHAIIINSNYVPTWLGNYTALGFAYTVGGGLQTMFTPHWQGAIAYQFADLGKSYLSGNNGTTITRGIGLTHFYNNQLMFSLGYIF